MKKKNNTLLISILSVLFGFILGIIVVFLTGKNPLDMIYAIIKSMTGYDITRPARGVFIVYPLNWLNESLPIILTGLSVAFAYRTGLFNIGAEGQYMIGTMAASMVALWVKLPPIIHPIVIVLTAALAGALWGAIPGILKAYRKINEVVICIMLNYIAMHFVSYVVKYVLPLDPNSGSRTIDFPASSLIPKLNFGTTSFFNYSFIFIIIGLIIFHIIIEKTTFGFSLRATGFNQEGARYAGMNVNRNIVLSMMISGAFAGLAGGIVILGSYGYGRMFSHFDNYGFDGISVALVGAANSIGVFFSGLLFGLLKSSTNNLQISRIPKEISDLIQAAIIFGVSIQYFFIVIKNKFFNKKGAK